MGDRPVSPLRQAFRDSRARKDKQKQESARVDGEEKWLPADEWFHFEVNRMMDEIAHREGRTISKATVKFRDSGLEAIREGRYHAPPEVIFHKE